MSIARAWRLASCLALVAASCAPGPTFQCTEDADCVLAGDKGQCQANGSCGYPDDRCESGLSYAAGAPAELAGRCVDGPAASDGTAAVSSSGDVGDASTGGASHEGTTGPAAEDSGDGSTSLPPPMTGTADGPGTGTVCDEDPEPDEREAARQEFGCRARALQGSLRDEEDRDWFNLGSCKGSVFDVTVAVASESMHACVIAGCETGKPAGLECGELQVWRDADGEFTGCCGTGSLTVISQCPDTSQVFVLARTNPELGGGGETCADYEIAVSSG